MTLNSVEVYNLSKRYVISKEGFLDLFPFIIGIINLFKKTKGKLNTEKRVYKREVMALNNVSFNVARGTILGIIGKNGAGKTTLLKLLARVTSPTEGKAVLRGRVVSLLEIGTGFHPYLSARENILLNAAVYGVDQREAEERMDEIIKFAELEQFIDTPVRFFSSGMFLRYAFSIAINMNPDILLADEVLAVGDIGFQKKCMDKMKQIGESGATVMFVSHDMEAIKRLCTYCIRLDEGRVIDSGDPEHVVERYKNDLLSGQQSDLRSIKGPHISEYGAITAVRLLSSEMNEIGAIKRNEDNFIQITYQMFKSDIDVLCAIDIYVGDMIVFRSTPQSPFHVHESGIYSALIKIPKQLMAEIDYNINATVKFITGDSEEDKNVISAYNAISFTVYDSVLKDGGVTKMKKYRAGVVSPVLDWQFTKGVKG